MSTDKAEPKTSPVKKPGDLATYMATARQYLSPQKVAEFEAAYRRMKERADRWGSPSSGGPIARSE